MRTVIHWIGFRLFKAGDAMMDWAEDSEYRSPDWLTESK